MVDLDAPEVYRKFDPSGMLARIRQLPQQCRQGWQKARGFSLPSDYSQVERVVLLGMGGSAIGGDLLQSLLSLESTLPVWVHRDYDLPPFVDDRTLVIASSYSGQTEETLSSFAQALERGAKALALTTGGKLRALAEKRGVPLFHIDYLAEPRVASGYAFLSLVGILQNLGLLSDKSKDMEEMERVLEELAPRIDERCPLAQNPVKQLALELSNCLTVVYGAGILSPVARRWKTQLNENSKAWAFYEVLPELDHNSVVGYEFPSGLKEGVFVVMLRSFALSTPLLKRYQVTAEVLQRAEIPHKMVEARGESPLSQMMSLAFYGDFVSYYLAMLNEIDPSPVPTIEYLKERLDQG